LGSTAKSLRIVLIEDHLDTADVLKRLLECKGYLVDTCHSGSEALGLVPAVQPDIVLLDIGLPDMDGCNVARLLRQQQGFKSVLVARASQGPSAGARSWHRSGTCSSQSVSLNCRLLWRRLPLGLLAITRTAEQPIAASRPSGSPGI